MHAPASLSARRRSARLRSGQALFGAFASTIRLLRWLLFGLVAIYLCSGITRVGPNEDALVYRLGTLQREVHPPGLLLALPPPLDRVVRLPTRTQHAIFMIGWSGDEDSMEQANALTKAATEIRRQAAATPPLSSITSAVVGARMPADMAATAAVPRPPDAGLNPLYNGYSITGDVNLLQARFTIRYRITDPLSFIQASPFDQAWQLVENSAFDAATLDMAGLKIDDALGSGLEGFRARVRAGTQKRLDALRLGVEVTAFEVNLITPPQAAAAAFADVTSAQVEARTVLEKARTYRAQVLPSAQSDAFRIRSQASADARALISKASAEATSFTTLAKEYRTAPALIEQRLRAETLEAVFPQIKTATVLPGQDNAIDLFLPSNP
jgi:membrane protease subunit HflK